MARGRTSTNRSQRNWNGATGIAPASTSMNASDVATTTTNATTTHTKIASSVVGHLWSPRGASASATTSAVIHARLLYFPLT